MSSKIKSSADTSKQQLILYGRHAVLAALQNPKRQIFKILCTKENAEDIRRVCRLSPQIVERKDIDKLFASDVVHQGFALFCSRLPNTPIEEIITKANTQEH